MERTILTSIPLEELQQLIRESVKGAISEIKKPDKPDEENLITIKEVSGLLKKSEVTIHCWKKKGLLPFYRISNKVYFKKSEILGALKKIDKNNR